MAEFEEKLSSILADPQMMQQIMSMAQALGQSPPPKPDELKPEPPKSGQTIPTGMDTAMLQRLMGIARQSGVDKNQQNLLQALRPYLSHDRILRLERAMRAAKLATVITSALHATGISFYSGR